MRLPLEGVRIVEMGQLIAIPYSIKLLADMGAQVVRVESCTRLEGYRASSFYENSAEGDFWNRGANFYEQNRNKLGLTLDLAQPKGLETLKELISISDVFAENFTPRVMKRFGLELDDLRRIRPDLIMVSSTGYGHRGPWANFGAIGYTTEAASGLPHVTGYVGGPPAQPEIPYADYTAAEHTAFAIMAALVYRARTGGGQFIDISQAQALSSTIPEALMDYTVNGRVAERMGNRDPSSAPHGCYRCAGEDNWIAIAVATDTEWQALCRVLDRRSWEDDDRFMDGASRREHQDELDELVGEATRSRDQYELMTALQGAGVPSGAVLNSRQLLTDPHLTARGFYETVTHHPSTGMPPLPYASRPWRMSGSPVSVGKAAPIMGEHNAFVLSEVLGLPPATMSAFSEDGVIGERPVSYKDPTVVSLEDQKMLGRILAYDPDFRQRLEDHFGE